MRTYLRIANPLVALVVLLLCLWSALFDDGHFQPQGILGGGIPTYFLAKGLFCSAALFLMGNILLVLHDKAGQ